MDTLERILDLIGKKFGTDVAFEKAAGAKPKTVDNWRRRRSTAYTKQITNIAQLLDTSSSYLLCETDNPSPIEKQKASPGEAEAEALAMLIRLGVLEPNVNVSKEEIDYLLSHFKTFADGLLK